MKSQEFIAEGWTEAQKKFSDTFMKLKLPLQSVDIKTYDDEWVKVSAKGVKLFRAGTQEKIQFRLSGWWDPETDEINGAVFSQGNSMDKSYSQVLDMEDDQHTLEEFANKVSQFVSGIAKAEAEKYMQGEREYWAKGGTGMMPGSVTKAE